MANECSEILGGRALGDYGTRDRVRPSMPLDLRFLFGLLLAYGVAGCGSNGGDASPVPAPVVSTQASAPSVPAWGGHFIGTVMIGDVAYYGDAVLTSDGAVRLYVGGPADSDGTVQQSKPQSSEQFVGNLQVNGGQALGSGIIIGQGCAVPHAGVGFCSENASGEISIAEYTIGTGTETGIQGKIQVTKDGATVTWSLNLAPLETYYAFRAQPEYVRGTYQEELAEFSVDGDTTISVDLDGQLFFQSVHSSCIGNGTLTPHLDGRFDIYDVTLVISSCNTPYDYLNGKFEGLATSTPSSLWDYDSLLRAWLSKQDDARPPAAVTMLGLPTP
jgi:hypothetical protein